jgi:trk system potassium uptake protein TrkH
VIYKGGEIEELFRTSLFQVVAIMTTTGYATKDIGAPIYLGVSKQIFLVLMIIGGSVGSTSGGVKVLRIGILLKLIKTKISSIINPPRTPSFIKVDGRRLEIEEVNRVSALFGAWIFLLIIGGLVTALFSDHNAIQSFSGMASALGNIGPCYISTSGMIKLLPIVKITYIIGMLAGRLEILPILMLFFKNTWR